MHVIWDGLPPLVRDRSLTYWYTAAPTTMYSSSSSSCNARAQPVTTYARAYRASASAGIKSRASRALPCALRVETLLYVYLFEYLVYTCVQRHTVKSCEVSFAMENNRPLTTEAGCRLLEIGLCRGRLRTMLRSARIRVADTRSQVGAHLLG